MKTKRMLPMVGGLLMVAACPGPEAGSGDEAGGTGQEPDCEYGCDNCSEIHLWTCECYAVPNFVPVSPAWHTYPCPGCSASSPDSWCKNTICDVDAQDPDNHYVDYRLLPIPICYVGASDDGVDETGAGACGSWDPNAEVSLVNRVYYLNETFIDDLFADPSPLVDCDDARFDEVTSPVGFQIQDSDLGEFLYALGLRDGDIPLTINSLPLETYEDAIAAFSSLYMTQGETSYVLEVKRGTNTIELDYELQ